VGRLRYSGNAWGRPFFSTLARFSKASSSAWPVISELSPKYQFDRLRHVLVVLVPQIQLRELVVAERSPPPSWVSPWSAVPGIPHRRGRPSIPRSNASSPVDINRTLESFLTSSCCIFGSMAAREVPEISTSLMHFTAIGAIFLLRQVQSGDDGSGRSPNENTSATTGPCSAKVTVVRHTHAISEDARLAATAVGNLLVK